jgi:hypothetical protein
MKVLIVGGGIGGLSIARELALRGIQARVLERAPQLNPVGAGIIMNPNAMRVLERNGLADQVRADSWPYLTRETRDSSGRLLAMRDYRPLYEAGKLAQGRWHPRASARRRIAAVGRNGCIFFFSRNLNHCKRGSGSDHRRRHPSQVPRLARCRAPMAIARTLVAERRRRVLLHRVPGRGKRIGRRRRGLYV